MDIAAGATWAECSCPPQMALGLGVPFVHSEPQLLHLTRPLRSNKSSLVSMSEEGHGRVNRHLGPVLVSIGLCHIPLGAKVIT
jgi:hypothetical protein